MPIIALPWSHTHNNSSEKNVLTTPGDTEKEQHGETKVPVAFYKSSSVCCLPGRQPLSKRKTQCEMIKPEFHQTAGTQRTHRQSLQAILLQETGPLGSPFTRETAEGAALREGTIPWYTEAF